MNFIKIKGAREHNLKNISLNIPRNKFVVFTGVSGSGKSSLVYSTIFTEAQRQYLDSLGTFARRRLAKFSRPDVEEISGISPVIMIDQKRLGRNPRSTVGTATEVYTYLRLLFSRCGKPCIGDSTLFSFNRPSGMCKKCKGLGTVQEVDPHLLLDFDKSLNEGAVRLSFCKPDSRTMNIIKVSERLDFDKKLRDYTKEELDFLLYSPRIVLSSKEQGFIQTFSHEGIAIRLKRYASGTREVSKWSEELMKKFAKSAECTECKGSRLNKRARSVKINGKSIADLVTLELTDLREFIKTVKGPLAEPIVAQIDELLAHLVDIGVGYLSLNQPVRTLSGGESQRVKMAKQLGCDLINLIYILDEPSIGLHQRDIGHLLIIIKKLRDKGNSVLVVEHDPAIIEAADHIIDLGPGAGKNGGEIVFEGSIKELKKSKTITGKYLSKDPTPRKKEYRKASGHIEIKNAKLHNLKNITVNLPIGVFTCVTGVAGSGKSTLINDIFAKQHPEAIVVDQSAVGKSVRSNPMTYTKIFGLVRREFAKATGESESLFSFNSKGACQKCKGVGFQEIEMNFMASVKVTCDVCEGKRYTQGVLKLKYKDRNIHDVLEMTAKTAMNFFESKEIKRRLKVLEDVGLDYLELGQSLDSLSGGEAQRIKLARELHKKGNIYILDEPTTGLHMADIEKLLKLLNKLVENGNTVVVIEHNLDVIKNADWIIDLGPEGGAKGGEVIASGTPLEVSKIKKSYTGQYLRKIV